MKGPFGAQSALSASSDGRARSGLFDDATGAKCYLLAAMYGKFLIFSGESHRQLAEGICGKLGLRLGESTTTKFSNENLMVQIEENVREADVFVVQTAAPPLHQNIFELLIMIDALKSASAARVTAVIPYFPYVRSDKKDRPRISITAKLMADLISAAGADRVLTMDLHSAQVQGFFGCQADQLQAINLMCEHLRTGDLSDAVLVASDAGEAKDVARYTSRLDLPMAIIDKRRVADDENPRAAHIIGEVKGKRCILVDDEIASGGTLLKATELLLEHGALDVRGVATHAVFSGRALERIASSPIAEVIVTDTIPLPPDVKSDKIRVLSVDKLLADAIRSIHDGTSVSALFQ